MIKLSENYNQIDEICKKYRIRNFKLNLDDSIDVWGGAYLGYSNLEKFPLKFRRIYGNFYCNDNRLTTLEGAPNWVQGDFDCDSNNLTTLKGAPIEVGGDFHCNKNKLTTLEGAPRKILGYFGCTDNKLTNLEHFPKESEGPIFIANNNFPEYFSKFIEINIDSRQLIIKQIIKWQDDYELWKNPKLFNEKFKRMMVDIQEYDLSEVEIKFP